jgi:hypothetical protein
MAAEMRLYRVTVIGSNAERKRGKVVDEVTVKVGTKWLTDDNGRRYYKVPSEDANRSSYFQQNTMYCMDYRLYQTEQAAKDYLRQAELRVALCSAVSNFGFNAPLPVLEKVMDTLKYTPFAQRLTSVFNTLTDMAVDGGLTDEERSKNNGC